MGDELMIGPAAVGRCLLVILHNEVMSDHDVAVFITMDLFLDPMPLSVDMVVIVCKIRLSLVSLLDL